MLPSPLPAFSPPSGVSSAPSRAASSGLTAARSSAGASSSTAAVKRISGIIAATPIRLSARGLGPGEVREQVPVADHAVVLEPPGDHVTPGEPGGERGTWLDLAGKLGVAAEVRIAAEVGTRPVVAQTKAHGAAAQPVLETRHVIPAGFDEQHRLGSLENIGEDLGG